jgi:hypothetical protein
MLPLAGYQAEKIPTASTVAPAPVVTRHEPDALAASTSRLYTPTGVLAGTVITVVALSIRLTVEVAAVFTVTIRRST